MEFYTIIRFAPDEKYPCFAKPIFIDKDGNLFCQKKVDNKFVKEYVELSNFKNLLGDEASSFLNITIEGFENNEYVCFAFSKTKFEYGRKKQVAKFLKNNIRKHKKFLKNPFIAEKIMEYVAIANSDEEFCK